MRSHIAAANRETGPVLEEATSLMNQRKQLETKQQILHAFNSHFLISDEEATVLTSTAEPVNEEFFQVLTLTLQRPTERLDLCWKKPQVS